MRESTRLQPWLSLLFVMMAGFLFTAQCQDEADTTGSVQDTVDAILLDTTLAEPLDSVDTESLLDTLTALPDTSATPPDTAVLSRRPEEPAATTEESQKIQLIKRDFRFGEQIGIAVGMMAFVAFMMITAQSWNPN